LPDFNFTGSTIGTLLKRIWAHLQLGSFNRKGGPIGTLTFSQFQEPGIKVLNPAQWEGS